MSARTAPRTTTSPAPRLSVLLIEHHADMRTMYASYLAFRGCEVEECGDAREGLAYALAKPHDAIVIEAWLPGFSGLDLCRLLREDPVTATTPVIMLADDSIASDAPTAVTLVKPCLPDRLLVEVRRLVNASIDRAQAARADRLPTDGRSTRPAKCRTHRRGNTTSPPVSPRVLHCPTCARELTYLRSQIGGVSADDAEQWDYFVCGNGCGHIQYRQRTRKLRHVS